MKFSGNCVISILAVTPKDLQENLSILLEWDIFNTECRSWPESCQSIEGMQSDMVFFPQW